MSLEDAIALVHLLVKKLVKRGGRPEAGKTENSSVEILGWPAQVPAEAKTLPSILSLFENDIDKLYSFVSRYWDRYALSLIAPEESDVLDDFFAANPNYATYLFRDKATGAVITPGTIRTTTVKKTGVTTETDVYKGIRMSFIKAVNGLAELTGKTQTEAFDMALQNKEYQNFVTNLTK